MALSAVEVLQTIIQKNLNAITDQLVRNRMFAFDTQF